MQFNVRFQGPGVAHDVPAFNRRITESMNGYTVGIHRLDQGIIWRHNGHLMPQFNQRFGDRAYKWSGPIPWKTRVGGS